MVIAHGCPTVAPEPYYSGYRWYDIADPPEGILRSRNILSEVFAATKRDGYPPEETFLLGFSQGGCLTLEYVARNARRYGAVAGLSAGLIGPDGIPRDYAGTLAGTPVFLGCSDIDGHIPLARVAESTRVLGALGAQVRETIYPGMGHTINDDEIARVRGLMARLLGSDQA